MGVSFFREPLVGWFLWKRKKQSALKTETHMSLARARLLIRG